MRKLTVKNFSVIKDAELEFGKITVLIGPQSSGKSLLCKLAYFLGKELVELAVSSISNRVSWNLYVELAGKEFLQRFSNYDNGNWNADSHEVTFTSFKYMVSIEWIDGPRKFIFRFSSTFQDQYLQLLSNLYGNPSVASGDLYPGSLNPSLRRYDNWLAFYRILSENVVEQIVYIPAGRAFFITASKGFALLQNPNIDSITREFATQIQWDSSWKVGLLTSGRGITDNISRFMTGICRGFVFIDDGVPRFLNSNGQKLALEIVSTGVQELTPLFNVLEQWMYIRENSFERARATYDPPYSAPPAESKPLIYVEEPEANVFPATQYQLVQLFSWLASDPILNFSWVITTHSPYLLSSFNNLIEAGQVVRDHPELRDDVAKIVPEQYWIKDGDFKAYSIHEGKLESILNESGFIEGNYLDQVSDVIEKEFDQLLRLEYDHSEAS